MLMYIPVIETRSTRSSVVEMFEVSYPVKLSGRELFIISYSNISVNYLDNFNL